MKASYLIPGLILLVIALVPLKRHLQEYDVQKHGQPVKVLITSIPGGGGYMKFKFGGAVFDKKVGRTFDEHHKVGDTLVLKYKEGSDIFLFEKENIESEFVAFGLIGLFGVFMLIKGITSSDG